MEIFDELYDPFLSCNLLSAYKNGVSEDDKKELLCELVYQLAPLVGKVAMVEMNFNLGQHTLDVLKLEALEYVFFTLKNDYIPRHIWEDDYTFTRYFWTIIKRGLNQSYEKNVVPSVFDFWHMGYDQPHTGRVPSHDDAEIALYLNQFYKTVLRVAVRDIRFVGVEKKACIYIGQCLFGLRKYHPMSARFKFNLHKDRTMFLVQYMEHLLKVTANEIKRIDDSIGDQEEYPRREKEQPSR